MSRTMACTARGGFTLVELLVAMAIAGLLVLTVHRLVSASMDQSRRVTRARTELNRRENASRWLSEVIGSIDVGKDAPGPFVGTTASAEFTTWLRTPRGWYEPDRVTLARQDGRLVASRQTGERIVLADSVASVELDYLVEWGAAAPWLRTWTSSVNAPLAVRLRVRHAGGPPAAQERVDTMVCLVWRRG